MTPNASVLIRPVTSVMALRYRAACPLALRGLRQPCVCAWCVLQIWAVVSWRVRFLVQVCRCGRDLLGFGLCRAVGGVEFGFNGVG